MIERRAVLAGAFLAFSCAGLCAWALPAPSASAMRLSFAQLTVNAGAQDYQRLASTIPLLLSARVSLTPFRFSSEEELLVSEKIRLIRNVYAAGLALSESRKKLDRLPLSNTSHDKIAADRIAAEREVAAGKKALDAAILSRDAPLGIASYPRIRPLAKLESDTDITLLPAVNDPESTCRTNKTDILIYGELSNISGFARLSMNVYLASTGKIIDRFSLYAFPDDPEELAKSLAPSLMRSIAGRDFSIVRIDANPASMALELSGTSKPYCASAREFFVYEPGTYTLTASDERYEPLVQEITVNAGSIQDISINLENREARSFVVTTNEQAILYLESEYSGEAPNDITLYSERGIGEAIADGFRTEYFVLDQNGPEQRALTLDPLPEKGVSGFGLAKDNFYGSLGRFVISLPFSILSYGYFQMYYNAQVSVLHDLNAGTIPQSVADTAAVRLEGGFVTSQTIFWVSLAASAALFVDVCFNYVKYLESTE